MVLRLGLGPRSITRPCSRPPTRARCSPLPLDTGRQLWEKNLKLPLSAGPAAALGMVVVGSSKGDVIALDGATGRELWRCARQFGIAVGAGDRRARRRAALGGRTAAGSRRPTGKELWSVEQQVPRLSLRGTATPVIAKDIGDLRLRQRQGHGRFAEHRRHGLGYGARLAARPHRTRPLGRRRFGGTRRSATMSMRRDSRAAPRCSRSIPARSGGRTTCRAIAAWRSMPTRVRHAVRRHRRRFARARRFGTLAQRQIEAARPLEHAGDPQHRGRGRGLSGLRALARQEHRSPGRPQAGREIRVSNPPVAVDDTVVVLTDGGDLAAFRANAACAARRLKP
jgi:hypothetical protein